MVEEMPENADTSDNLLALIEQTQQCLVLLNNAECMFYSGLICLHALSLCPSVCLCVFVCCFAFSSLQFFKHGFFFQRVHWVLIFWTFDWHFLMYKDTFYFVPLRICSLLNIILTICSLLFCAIISSQYKSRFLAFLNADYMFGYTCTCNRNVIFCIFITPIQCTYSLYDILLKIQQ